MYKSPITIIESTINSLNEAIIKQREDAIFAEIQSSFGVDLDKKELIRALQYDRNQYEKGYADGKRDAMDELVRCKDCKYWDEDRRCNGRKNGLVMEYTWDDDFCSYGERKDNE